MRNQAHAALLLFLTMLFLTAPVYADNTVLRASGDQKPAAVLTFSAAPLKTMTAVPFNMTFDSMQTPIQSATCDLTMPAMPMPENRPELNCSNNKCSGTAVFTMAGRWQAAFSIVMEDGSRRSLVFAIPMVKMK